MHTTIVMVATCTLLLLACGEKKTETETDPETTKPSSSTTTSPEAPSKEGAPPGLKTDPNVASRDAKEPIEAPLAEDLAPKKVTPVPGTTRIVVVLDHEALRSEKRQIDKLTAKLAKGKTADDAPTSPEERAHFAALLTGTHPPLPANWASIETVFVISVATPRTNSDGKKKSQGFSGLVMYAPPQLEPIMAELSPYGNQLSTDEFSKLVRTIYKESMNDK